MEANTINLKQDLEHFIEARDLRRIRDALVSVLPADAADLISELTPEQQAIVFRVLPKELGTKTFELLNVEDQKKLIAALGNERLARIINEMAPDDRTALLEDLPEAVAQGLLDLLSSEERNVAENLLHYPEDSVGRLMTPDYLSIQDTWNAEQVLEHIRERGKDEHNINALYVLDKTGKLTGELRIKRVLLSPLDRPVKEMAQAKLVSLKASDDQQIAVDAFRKYDRTMLPVVDEFGFMMGVVTVDDALDVAEEEATEDIQKLGGVEALEDPYIEARLTSLIRKRATWLIMLFIGEMLTASAMAFFQDEISKAVVLALFVPLIISSGGNSGSQASTLIIRALAIGEIQLRDWKRVLSRELISGFALGGILGLIGFLRIAVWSSVVTVYGPHWLLVALTVGISLVLVVLWGSLTGSMLPFLLKKLGIDPATSSAPFVATLVDVTGLVIYFSLASWLLQGLLL
jgi:magnesium transporter